MMRIVNTDHLLSSSPNERHLCTGEESSSHLKAPGFAAHFSPLFLGISQLHNVFLCKIHTSFPPPIAWVYIASPGIAGSAQRSENTLSTLGYWGKQRVTCGDFTRQRKEDEELLCVTGDDVGMSAERGFSKQTLGCIFDSTMSK